MSRGRCAGSSSGDTFGRLRRLFARLYREKAATVVSHDLTMESLDYKGSYQCKFKYHALQLRMAEAEAVDGACLACDFIKEGMKGCPGFENIKFQREGEGILNHQELMKLPEQQMQCLRWNTYMKRAILKGQHEEAERNKKRLARWDCDEFLKRTKLRY